MKYFPERAYDAVHDWLSLHGGLANDEGVRNLLEDLQPILSGQKANGKTARQKVKTPLRRP